MDSIIRIEGMNCEHCANKVQRALNELPDTRAEVSLEEGLARVHHPQDLDPGRLEDAVRQAGYSPFPPEPL
jgi:Cu+-exporting ATPase